MALRNGSVITLKPNATYYTGKTIPSWIFNKTLYYRGTNANGVIFSVLKTGAITGVVDPKFVNELNTETTKKTVKVELINKCLDDIKKLDSFKELSSLL